MTIDKTAIEWKAYMIELQMHQDIRDSQREMFGDQYENRRLAYHYIWDIGRHVQELGIHSGTWSLIHTRTGLNQLLK